MIYSFYLRQEAAEEFADAFVWYEEQQEGLGSSFKVSVNNKLTQICNYPFHYKTSYKNFHEALTEKFPFLIVYTIDEKMKQIVVVAIFHTSRHPKRKFRK